MALTNPELKTEINAEIESIGETFDSLLRASSTLGTHFQFTVEKRWDDSKNVIIPSYFVLNLESVAENLSQIPFFERLQINQPLLEKDLSVKTIAAASCGSRPTKDSIAKCLENAEVSKDLNSFKLSNDDSENHTPPNKSKNADSFRKNEDITCTLKDSITGKSVANEAQGNVELDDWLDSVLDD